MSGEPQQMVRVVPGQGFQVGDELVRLVSGAVHYWRLDPARWSDIFDRVKELGFRVVETYVPWSVHETADGTFDFSGQLDVEAFVRLAGDKGLRVLVRPGPHINSELPDYGFPRRVLWNPACQALGPLGTPVIIPSPSHFFPAPSYASTAFLREVTRWYDEIAPRLAALQALDGPVIGCQVDNEMGYFFHVEAFGIDYHPELVEGWRHFSGFDGDPPVDGSDDPERIDAWVAYRQRHREDALAALADQLRERGINRVPLFHNDFAAIQTPIDQATLEDRGIDVAGNDLYVQRDNIAAAKLLTRTLAGSSQLPYIPEFGAGWISDPTAIPQRILPEDEDVALLTAMLCGARAWSFYMLVERQLWYGSPISRHGEIRPRDAELYQRMHRVLDELGWWDLQRVTPALLLHNRTLDRRIAGTKIACETTAALNMLQFTPALREPGEPQSSPSHSPFANAWRARLESAGLDFDEGSTDSPPDLSRYELVLVEQAPGSEVVIDHPRVVSSLPGADALPKPSFEHDSPGVSLHNLVGGGREVLGAINTGRDAITTTLRFDGTVTLRGVWRDGSASGTDKLVVELPPYGGQMWEVERG